MLRGRELLRDFFGKYPPETPEHARVMLGREGAPDFPPEVFEALSRLSVEGMDGSDSPKRRDRECGEKIRKKRTGSSRG